jgi:hypothetical protein
LRAGVRGVLSSLPELAFVNLRKGSLPFVAHAELKSDDSDVLRPMSDE